jgi:TfoX/Sxy family transcriptional regulator of competence genes
MATSEDFINYICEQIKGVGEIRYRKMFGEYLIYVNDKPVITVCNNTAFVKKVDVISELMKDAEIGFPYKDAKEHYILDIDNSQLTKTIVEKVEKVTLVPKKKNKK